MANRHLSRSIVMQSLFEIDFRNFSVSCLEEVVRKNIEEFASGMGDFLYMKNLISNIFDKKKDLDLIIEKAAPDWPINKISIVDRNILRLGLYELLFSDRKEVPAKVAINEAIELAKTFGGETSSKFINGVLGAVYKEIGEPGKDEASKNKNDETLDAEVPVERLAGAVVYAKNKNSFYLAFIHDIFKHWTLSKGHLKENEDDNVGVKRVIKDEIGIDVEVKENLGENTYIMRNKEKKKIKKHVVYFLVGSKFEDLKLKESGGLDDAKWFPIAEIDELNFYDDVLPIITKAVNILLNQKK